MNSLQWELKFESICEEINNGSPRPHYHYTNIKFEREFQEWLMRKKDYKVVVDLIFAMLSHKFDEDIILAYNILYK